mmetsp:Transcript_70272/g.192869  ORF Transcript_70272/g.192869 Transcript_70272/m.192869 type:complete len:200 (+) Transcript_70272:726-1325(+)
MMQKSTKASMVMSSCCSSRGRETSYAGRLAPPVRADSTSKRFLSITGVPNVRTSISSVTAAKALPALQRAAQLASASEGASTTGQPSSRSSSCTSSFICGVMRAVLCAAFTMSSLLAPPSMAAASSTSASAFFSARPASVCDLSSGGLPSKTYTGLMPSSSMRIVRLRKPWMCDVTSPASFERLAAPASPACRTATRNW